uniref:Uncharacterized protein n=1 Tax=Anguilla anguilla TaxID=7936 RepID=A0A0E9SP35_ANGAN
MAIWAQPIYYSCDRCMMGNGSLVVMTP